LGVRGAGRGIMDPVEEKIRRLHERTTSCVRRLRAMDFTMLEAEIMDRLMDGRRTAVELVVEIYGLSRGDASYAASCNRVRRALRSLENRGFVSTNLFGRDKPYRLTRHGVAVLASISPLMREPKVLPVWCGLVFASTILAGLAMFAASNGLLGNLSGWGIYSLVAVFFALFGFSLAVLILLGRRVL